MAPRESAAPVVVGSSGDFDLEADIVVVGGGGAGLPVALFGRWLGDEVILLEKAADLGGTTKEEPNRNNPTMWPISETDPYYAALVTGGTPDAKGGPKATPDGQIVDDSDRTIPGLYGVGNCVASASARAYWAGGAILEPILKGEPVAASPA